ncbi:hypothetical protein [Nocardioides sp. L-11A]|uniref:hypothetical protein n=1 Tax=Nocardioides sp. L-11A TaxID=3043848 RepID=UPI00249C539F|nr:hypothetical protein QJ852_01670 [Nocardioides sp. L-11A]
MFTHHCTSCERRELIFPDQLTGLDNVADGFQVHFTCWCGAPQTHFTAREVAAA